MRRIPNFFLDEVTEKLPCAYFGQKRIDARIFRHILNDYLLYRERSLLSLNPNWGQEVARWLNKVGGMAGEW
jgi:hypothetical protein